MALTQAEKDELVIRTAAEVWAHGIGSAWDGQPQTAERALTSAQRYAIEASAPVNRPPGNGVPGTPTFASQLFARLAALEAKIDALSRPT